ncbi:Transcription-repair-coupling factor [Capnocytophaga canimorsus]|uniref:Transcription-repair-coupling factor n=1 Tax=Capnocytophaga canimorsus TaxID=28188 RepID=A0A0B7HI43_9FLAO|nr:transcription-repair coupling factor [Capnocytophaga canimorsus]ATA77453.1 transcription-repair coupling factor [Capnocytophaga canimorsus]PJI82427.1 transcription-repair coupling factor (superfamily II helicase) [Capnocytophaga canimorsus]CEN38930.1 Transcription-repair-coupling factor [Capnocytophaga canimorsus]STA72718.1 Transcription-repair-coupling factor [Capnocytophaga canimorsus]
MLKLGQSIVYSNLEKELNHNKSVDLNGLSGASLSFVIANLFRNTKRNLFVMLSDKEEAAYFLNDLESLLGDEHVIFFPDSYRRPYQIEDTDNANVLLRAEVLNRLGSHQTPLIVVSYPEALFEKVITRKQLEKNTLKIKKGDSLSLDFLNEILFTYNFNRTDFVTEPGEFSVRGGIVDVFSFSNNEPYRIEFFGNEIESIRTFDVETQLSTQQLSKITIIPNIENKENEEVRQSILEYISEKTLFIAKDIDSFPQKIDKLFNKSVEIYEKLSNEVKHIAPEVLFCQSNELLECIGSFQSIFTGANSLFSSEKIVFRTNPQPAFNKQFELLISYLNEKHEEGFTNYIICSTEQQAKRFDDIFKEMEQKVHYQTAILSLHSGFVDSDNKINVFTDHQIFERYHKFHLKNGYAKKQAITLKELTQLTVGDYVTHIDHGIGKFAGLQKIEVEGKMQEAIKLIYGDRDVLFVSIHSLHKITKYNGKDGKPPKIYKLGSGAWKALKQKTKARVKEIAFNLIQLYAKRKESSGFAFAHDSYLQNELEASFLYEDTPDQSKATAEVKADMESPKPMDRLVCGDVGFGKTEVAIRAAFKAVDNGKQVAVLVPTTILAFQHYQTFSSRMKDFPVRIDYLNRFRTAKEKKNILEELAKGSLDIIIGTHQIVNESVKYKDLGLLIVDEEQKFGVGVKDKLKTLKENLDVLTLTATPIPRTLQFSLMAARDLSVINTPPPNRYPIDSQVIHFNEEIIRDAVAYEIQRGGQVFFINNRVENIREVAGMLQRLVPDAKIAVGHGQMDGKKLEETMLAFMDGAYDVLVATTIIESGLDVPNANTIFINNAHNFGLSDLHQMRGRVGRSNKKAFCYFITPPFVAMSDDARKRIQAIAQFSDLGSGFNIAMKDLEIRGAGDLLGGEQSGFINEIGFETYQKILQEAIVELKENEFSELYQTKEEDKSYLNDTQIDSDFELLFPDTYVNRVAERLNLYNELSNITSEVDLLTYEKNLIDRFGQLPPQAVDLLNSVRLKWFATKMGIEKLVMKNGKMTGYFISDQESPFYQSSRFQKVLQFVQRHPDRCRMQEKETRNGLRLLLHFNNINTIAQALKVMQLVFNEQHSF